MTRYPDSPAARDRWILQRRPPRQALDPRRPHAFLAEQEPGADGEPVDVATIFLVNRECPWRCLMCDLWRNTLATTVPAGAIAEQIRFALDRLPKIVAGRSQLKLYNAGSFFDPGAIPPAEHPEIARLASKFERTIVECHPALVGPRCLEFRDQLGKPLEVALGLETVHPVVLERLNKRMSLERFRSAAEFLRGNGVDVRVFILVRPPWTTAAEGVEQARRSLDYAFECGASTCSLIPTRGGNGAMEALRESGEYAPPALADLETALEYGLRLGRGRVFADLWDADAFADCPACSEARIDRLRRMNATQSVPPPTACDHCPARG